MLLGPHRPGEWAGVLVIVKVLSVSMSIQVQRWDHTYDPQSYGGKNPLYLVSFRLQITDNRTLSL